MNHIKRVPLKKKKKTSLGWLILYLLIGMSIGTSVYFGVLHVQRINQRILSWKGDCLNSGGVWYARILDDYKEYVCRIEVEK